MGHLSKKWTLKSLTIGPQLHETDIGFWEEAFNHLPSLPRVGDVTIVYNYPTVKAFTTDCWTFFDRILTRRDLFPALELVRVYPSIGSQQFSTRRWWLIYGSLRAIRMRGLMRKSAVQMGSLG